MRSNSNTRKEIYYHYHYYYYFFFFESFENHRLFIHCVNKIGAVTTARKLFISGDARARDHLYSCPEVTALQSRVWVALCFEQPTQSFCKHYMGRKS